MHKVPLSKSVWPGTTRVQIVKDGRTVATSANLRGILDYARVHSVVRVYVHQCDNPAKVLVLFVFDNGARSMTEWASFGVACDWIMSRRSWGLSLNHEYTPNMRLYA